MKSKEKGRFRRSLVLSQLEPPSSGSQLHIGAGKMEKMEKESQLDRKWEMFLRRMALRFQKRKEIPMLEARLERME